MKHDVKFSVPERELGKADIEFHIRKDNRKLGTLKISKGAVVWVERDNTYGHRLTWDKLEEVMVAHGKPEK